MSDETRGPIEQELMDRMRMAYELAGGTFPPDPEEPVSDEVAASVTGNLQAETMRALAAFAQHLDYLTQEVDELRRRLDTNT